MSGTDYGYAPVLWDSALAGRKQKLTLANALRRVTDRLAWQKTPRTHPGRLNH
jgi:hypothetical protein